MESEGNFIDLSKNESLNLPLKVKELLIFDHSRNLKTQNILIKILKY